MVRRRGGSEMSADQDRTEGQEPQTPGVTHWHPRDVIVQAMQWTGSNEAELARFAGSRFSAVHPGEMPDDPDVTAELLADAHMQWIGLRDGDWVVRGTTGWFFVVAAGKFVETYEPASSAEDLTDGDELAS